MKPTWTLCSEGVPENGRMVELFYFNTNGSWRIKEVLMSEATSAAFAICWRYTDEPPSVEKVQACDPCRSELGNLVKRVCDLEDRFDNLHAAFGKMEF